MHSLSPSFLFVTALLITPLRAQEREDWGRVPSPRLDRTIFSPLDLPTPTRLRAASGAPGPDYWQQQVDYEIAVSLDPTSRKLSGKERVTYTNNAPEPLDYVWVHLEQNLLRADSIGSKIGGGLAVGGPTEASDGVTLSDVTSKGVPLTQLTHRRNASFRICRF